MMILLICLTQTQPTRAAQSCLGILIIHAIKAGYSGVYFEHVQHISTGKCLKHDKSSLDFALADCPTKDTAKTQLPFWFESVDGGNIRFTGYKNTTAYPQPEWFAIPPNGTPFDIKTQQKGHNGKPNQYVLARPVRI